MLPRGVVDFIPQEGLQSSDVHLSDRNQLFIKKEFNPGLSLLGIGFKIQHSTNGSHSFSIRTPIDISELSIAVAKTSKLDISSHEMREGVSPMLGTESYKGVYADSIIADTSVNFILLGLPRGRQYMWVWSLLTTLILFLFSAFLTRYTINKMSLRSMPFS